LEVLKKEKVFNDERKKSVIDYYVNSKYWGVWTHH
jgi:hypothetical protein